MGEETDLVREGFSQMGSNLGLITAGPSGLQLDMSALGLVSLVKVLK